MRTSAKSPSSDSAHIILKFLVVLFVVKSRHVDCGKRVRRHDHYFLPCGGEERRALSFNYG